MTESATITTEQNYLEIYTRRRTEILALAKRQAALVDELGADQVQSDGGNAADALRGLLDRLESERLRVLVIGRFSAGKSTFLNALFGTPNLPAAPEPTTGVLCEIRYAEATHRRAVLYPKPGMGDDGGDEPFEVRLLDLQKELEKYVRIDQFGTSERTSRYRKLELYWPLELCRHGVDIVDSVGLDDPESRDEITLQYAKSADAILYCMKSHDVYSSRDKQVLSMLQGLGYHTIFFIITYYAHIREAVMLGQTTEEAFRRLQEKNLSPWTELGSDGIKYVDSQSALIGRMQKNAALVAESGIVEIERSLQRFLAREKGRAKLLTSLRSLRAVNRSVCNVIPARIGMWETSAENLEERYRNAEIPLRGLETTRRLIQSQVDSSLKDMTRNAADLAEAYFLELPDRVKEWAADYEFATHVGLPPSRENLDMAVREIALDLKTRITADVEAWSRETLMPMINAGVNDMRDSLESNARDFVQEIEKLRVEIALGVDAAEITSKSDTAVWQRIVAGGLGVVMGDLVGAGMGIAFGLKALVKAVVVEVGAALVLIVLGVANPLVAIPAILIAGMLGAGAWNLFSLKGKIRSLVGDKVVQDLTTRREELAAGVVDDVKRRLAGLRESIEAGLGGEISALRAEVQSILDAHKSGQANATREIARLKDIDRRNHEIEKELDDVLLEEGLGL